MAANWEAQEQRQGHQHENIGASLRRTRYKEYETMNERVEEDIERAAEQDVRHVDQADAGADEALLADPGGDPHDEKADAGGGGGLVFDGLALLPEKAMVDEAKLAGLLHVSGRTLRRLVARWTLPPPIRVGNRSLWIVGRILAHLEAAAARAEKDAERAARKYRENMS